MDTPSGPTAELVEVAQRVTFHKGLREKQRPFNEMLFSCNLDFQDPTPEPLRTTNSECEEYAKYLQLWNERERRISEDVSLAKGTHNALDAALRTAGTDSAIAAIPLRDTFAKANALLNTNAASANTCCVKLVVDRSVDDTYSTGRIVKLYFTEKDDWRDAQQSFSLWTNVYSSPVDHRRGVHWEYCFENIEGRVERERYVLDSSTAFKRMCARLHKSRTERSALVYQVAWREAFSKDEMRLDHNNVNEDQIKGIDPEVATPEQEIEIMEEFIEWCESDGFVCEYVGTGTLPPQSIEEWRASNAEE